MPDFFNTHAAFKKRLVSNGHKINFGIEFHTKLASFHKVLSIPEDSIKDEAIIQIVAAQINNSLMIFGAQKLTLYCPFAELSYAIVNQLRTFYPQIWDVLPEFYQSKFSIEFSNEPLELHSSRYFSQKSHGIQKLLNKNYSIGINIGQSAIKAVIICGDQIIHNSKITLSTPKTYKEVICAVKDLITKYTAQYNVSCAGICIGGIVRWGSLTTKSGITSAWTQNEFFEFQDIVSQIENEFGIVTTLYQDMVCSGYSISYFQAVTKSLVLGLGTSTGGVFIDEEGKLPDFLNQVGRVVIDLSEQAVNRTDGKAKGTVSQYFSMNGLKRLVRDNPKNTLTDDVMESFLDYALTSIAIFLEHYDPETLIFTGGFWASDANNRFADSLRDKLQQVHGQNAPLILISYDPVYDASIGAALMAASIYEKIEYAGKLVETSVANSLTKKIPACLSRVPTRAGLVLLNSERGRIKYINFNKRFMEQLIENSCIDLNLKKPLITALQSLLSDLRVVGELTPQEVQSIAARAVHRITENSDPFKEARQKNNFMVLEVINKVGVKSFVDPNHTWAFNFKRVLSLSALMNGLDVFYPEVLVMFLRQMDKTVMPNSTASIQKALEEIIREKDYIDLVGYDDFRLFEEIVSNNAGCKILYFVDNSGELVFDLLAIEILLQKGYSVTLVSKSEPFADDVYEGDILYLIREFPDLMGRINTGQLKLNSISSDFLDFQESFVAECSSASVYIAKGTRNVNFLWQKDLIMPGLHVALNKSETVQSILEPERKSLRPVIFVFQNVHFPSSPPSM